MSEKERMVQLSFTVDAQRHARLHALSKATRVPASEYLREGLDRVLNLAEKQQAAAEAALRRREESER